MGSIELTLASRKAMPARLGHHSSVHPAEHDSQLGRPLHNGLLEVDGAASNGSQLRYEAPSKKDGWRPMRRPSKPSLGSHTKDTGERGSRICRRPRRETREGLMYSAVFVRYLYCISRNPAA
jgi:hypothetical protein